ncbi:ABC transporter ATP-binding protein [Aquamicrobium sp.]|uniref:ABC transporter ATP-binding protein n=1 Tax=Aquamicrobium sp. TaxID=1872579 RepID=UPI0025910099|nr:ABC transporter ATP-binding protein [Aquamicrobium sp.]MCK9549720.1 ABC transporter ATP-binding protein/permease [Aquamicrobium sp.]
MRRILLPRRWALSCSALLSVAAAALGLVPNVAVWYIATLIWQGEPIGQQSVLSIGALAFGAIVLKAIAAAISTRISHLAAHATLAELRLALARKLAVIPLGVFQARSATELKRVMADDVDQMEDAIAHAVPDIAAGLSVPLLSALMLGAVDWRLGIASIVMFPLLFLFYRAAVRSSKDSSAGYLAALAGMKASAGELVQGMKVIRAFLRAETMLDRFDGAVRDLAGSGEAYATASLRWMALFYAGMRANLLVIVPVGSLLLLHGDVTAPDFVLALLVGMGMNASALKIIFTAGSFFWKMQSSGKRIASLLDTPEFTEPMQPARPADAQVRFEGVTFRQADKTILDDISFVAAPGETTALVGPSGAGKSTILRLLARFLDPEAGRILIGGADIRDFGQTALLETMSVVFQDAWLMNDTIRANILMGRPDAGEADVRRVADAARVSEFAADLDMPAGEAGRFLSGGQRQRVMIARALLADRPILLLDEATASLDPDNEAHVLEALRELSKGRTVIVVAHRLHTIRNAGRIIYLEEGSIRAQGTHEELMATCAGYRKAVENYEAAEGWSLEKSGDDPASLRLPAQAQATPEEAVPREARLEGSTLAVLLRLAGPMRGLLLGRAFPLLVLESLMMAVPIFAIWYVLDAVLRNSLTATSATAATLAIAVSLLVQVVVNVASHRLLWRVQLGSVAALQRRLGRRLLAAPLGVIFARDTGALETTLTRTATELNFLTTSAQAARVLVVPAAIAVLMFWVDWRLALVALAILPPFIAVVLVSDGVYRRTMTAMLIARENLSSRILDFVAGMPVLRAYGLPSRGFDALAHTIEHHRQISSDATRSLTRMLAVGWLVLETGPVLLIVGGGLMFVAGTASAATWILFLMAGLAFYGPVADAFELSGIWRQQQGVIGRLRTVLDMPVLPEPRSPAVPASATVRFEEVSFSYGDLPALRSVSACFGQGKIHAIAGPSGSGKTTMLNMIARFWDPDGGRITIGGVDLGDVGTGLRSQLFSMVFQETFLFNDTVHANIAIGRPDATREEVENAARSALCHDFISRMENGYDTLVGEQGGMLSGGERQRIAIARALLKDAPIVLLDEATASVDPESEAQVRRAIARLCRGRTVILVAHRLETIRNVDQIVRL